MRFNSAIIAAGVAAAVMCSGCGLAGLATTAAGVYGIYAATSEPEVEIINPPVPTVLLGTVSEHRIEAGRVTAFAGSDATTWAGTYRAGVFYKTGTGGSWTPMNTGFNRNLSVSAIAIDPGAANKVLVATGNGYAGGVFATTNGGTGWTEASTGLTSLDVRCLAVVPGTTPQMFLAGTANGVYSTADMGGTWTSVGATGLNSLNVSALAVDPADTDDYYAATRGGGVFFTEDGGGTWVQRVDGLIDANVLCMAIHFAATDTLYIGTSTMGVWISTDGGVNWTQTGLGAGGQLPNLQVLALAVDPGDPDQVYAGTPAGLYVYNQGPDRWQLPTGTDPTDSRIISLHIDPTSSAVVFAGGYSHGISRSTDATSAENWAAVNTGLNAAFVDSIAASPLTATNLVAAGGYDIADGSSYRIAYSTNTGTNWSFPGTVPSGDDIRQLACDPLVPGVLYAAVNGDGVWRSTNDGLNWAKAWTGPVTEDVISIAAFDLGGTVTLFAGTDGDGAYRSTNDGVTWTQVTGIPVIATVVGFTKIALSSSEVWAATDSTVYASTTSGASFAATTGQIALTDLTCIQADPATALTVYVGTSTLGVQATTNGGTTFSAFNAFIEGSANVAVRGMTALAGATTSYVYLAASTGVYRLTCGGSAWNPVHDDDANLLTADKRRITVAESIAVFPDTPNTIWVGTGGRGVLSILIAP